MNVFIYTEECPGCGFYAELSPELAKVDFSKEEFLENSDPDDNERI